MNINTISYILRNHWAVDRVWATSIFPYVMESLTRGQLAPAPGLQREKSEAVESPVAEIGYIFASGVVQKYAMMSELVIELDDLNAQLNAFAKSDKMALVLHLDTPGGMVQGVAQTAKLIERIQAETGKKIYGYTDTMACSAGQWIIAPCARTFVDMHGMLGSIGVYTAIFDCSAAYEKIGYKIEMITSGKYKGAGAYQLPMTDEQKDLVRSEVNALAADFKSAMLQYRPDVPAEAMEGQHFTGFDAVANGLADYVADSIDDVFGYVVDDLNTNKG